MNPASIPADVAAHVLAEFDAGGYHGGRFTRALLAAFDAADPTNVYRLALGFPEYHAAWKLAAHDGDGIAQLRTIAGERA